MNANEKVKIDAELFVNHGWDGFQIFEKVTHERRYETLVHMKMVEKGLWKGDVVILSGDNLVAFIKGVTASWPPISEKK